MGDLGTLKKIQPNGEGKRLAIETNMDLGGTKIGDSIAVNGACLTVVTLRNTVFEVDMAPETVSRTTFKSLLPGARLNLERAPSPVRPPGPATWFQVTSTPRDLLCPKQSRGNAVIVTIGIPETLADEIIEKGSVAIDGISLTINRCSRQDFGRECYSPHGKDHHHRDGQGRGPCQH